MTTQIKGPITRIRGVRNSTNLLLCYLFGASAIFIMYNDKNELVLNRIDCLYKFRKHIKQCIPKCGVFKRKTHTMVKLHQFS